MVKYHLMSFNVNGVRAAAKKGFVEWMQNASPDVLSIQETKAHPEQLDDGLREPAGYVSHWHSAERKGYSGVATYSKTKPLSVTKGGIAIEESAKEGRILMSEFPEFTFIGVYFPNGKRDETRLRFKMQFYEQFTQLCNEMREDGRKLVVCGDVNTAHKPIDLARPKANEKISGFLPEERKWIDSFLATGFVDAFRVFNQQAENYTWWSVRTRAKERNVGWRIDYFFITEDLLPNLKSASIMRDVSLSDHCPIDIVLEF